MANVSRCKFYESKVGYRHYEGYLEFSCGHADLTAGATTEALTVPNFPTWAIPLRGRFNIAEYFTGGGATTCTAQLGDTNDPNGLIEALDVFSTTTKNSWTVAQTQGVESESGSTKPVLESAYTPAVLFTCSGNVSILTAGLLHGQVHFRRVIFT